MGLEHRGNRFSEDQDIIRLLDAKATAAEVPDASDASGLISSRTSQFANKSYVDSMFDSYATQSDVDAAYANKAQSSILGSSLLQLNEDRRIPPSSLPNMSTRGARWFNGGNITTRMDIGSGGWLNTAVQMASLTVSGSSMGNRPYHVLGFGQIETKSNFGDSNPQVYISPNAGFAYGQHIAVGHGIPGWLDWYHVTIVPATDNSGATSNFTGNTTFYLACRSHGTSSDFTDFMGRWGVLAIPVY